jgi:hypothetical protein
VTRPVVDPRRTDLKARRVESLWDPEGGYLEFTEPGTYTLGERAEQLLVLACPGCGRVSGMTVGDPKPDNRNGATWLLTGPADAPTLQPSINCVGCCKWHGWLTAGVFRSC